MQAARLQFCGSDGITMIYSFQRVYCSALSDMCDHASFRVWLFQPPNCKRVPVEYFVHCFECLTARLLEKEEDVDKSRSAKCSEYHVDPPLNILKGRWREERQGKVASPVEEGGQGHRLASDVERGDFGWVNPTYGTRAKSEESELKARERHYPQVHANAAMNR